MLALLCVSFGLYQVFAHAQLPLYYRILSHYMEYITNPLTYGIPFFLALIGLELWLSIKHDRHLYYWNDFFASVTVGAGAAILATFTKAASIAVFFLLYEMFKPVRMALFGIEGFGFAWYMWIICQFWDDFNYYWYHRLSHTVRVLWAAHLVHHSSENFNLGSGIRNGWVTLFYKPLFWLWMPIVGFHPIMVATCLGIQAIYQFHLHTRSAPHLGFLEKFMNTPRQHQVHHASNTEYLDKNHGGFLNIFDRIFGSYLDFDKEIDVKYGVLTPPPSLNPLVIVSYEYGNIWRDVKSASSWKDKFMYIFGEPGWKPGADSLTVKQMQQRLLSEQTVAAAPIATENYRDKVPA